MKLTQRKKQKRERGKHKAKKREIKSWYSGRGEKREREGAKAIATISCGKKEQGYRDT